MLVLSRKVGERILVGELGEIAFKVVRVGRRGSVRIGIEAPAGVPIRREEALPLDAHQVAARKKAALDRESEAVLHGG